MNGVKLATRNDGYTIVRLDTWRGERRLAPVEAHLARDRQSGEIRIIGLHRR